MKRIISSDTTRTERVAPGQKKTVNFPVLQAGGVQEVDISEWSFKISGLVEDEVSFNFEEFSALPRVEVLADIHCVTHWTRLDNVWEGVSTSEIKKLCRILPEAKFVTVHAAGDFTTNLPIEEFFFEDALFAFKHDGKELSEEHGWPVRLVVPKLYFWKSAKWVTGVEFMAEDRKGFWEWEGYHNHGDPWKEERWDW